MAKTAEERRIAARESHRKWQQQHKDKVKLYNQRYYIKKARELLCKELEEQNTVKCSGGGQNEQNRE